MVSIDYSSYLDNIPTETSNFIKWLLDYMIIGEEVFINGTDGYYKLFSTGERHFYYALKAFQQAKKSNSNYLAAIGFNDNNELSSKSCYDSSRELKFRDFANYFLPNYDEELKILMPEDIILRIEEKYNCIDVYKAISSSKSDFINNLKKHANLEKEKLKNDLRKNLLSYFPISTINYFNMAGNLFLYLRDTSSDQEIFNVEKNLTLSLLLAIYYYKHVSFNDDLFSDKEQIIELFNKKGLTKRDLENNMNVNIDESELSKIDSILIINRYYKNILDSLKSENKVYVPEVLDYVISNGFDGNYYYIKDILGKCGVTIRDLSTLNEIIEKRSVLNGNESSLETFYKYLSPSVIIYLKEVAKYYSYLEEKHDILNSIYVTSKLDQMVLAMFITNMLGYNDYKTFFVEQGITIEKVLELMNLPKFNLFNEEVNNCKVNEKLLLDYKKLLILGFSSEEDKTNLTIDNIVSNFSHQSKIGSTLVKKIFDTFSDKKLSIDYDNQINTYNREKETKRKKDLEEELFANISIDVYNYLKVVCSYYKLLNNKNLSDIDQEQLAIILGASRYESKLGDYLDSMGLSRQNLLVGFNVHLDYVDKPFDVDLVNTRLRPYIFDRDDEKISVYSIFANAFNPKLVNSIMLRKVIDHYSHKDCTYFMDIEKRFKEYDSKRLLNNCTADAKVIIETAVKIHDAIIDDKDKYNLLETDDDVKELAILLSFFKNNDDSIRFFQHNGIDLESISSIVGLPNNILDRIDGMKIDEEKIVDFENYITYYYGEISQENLLSALLSDVPNKSQLLEVITELRGSKYEYLVQEITNKKERDISIEEDYEILVGEVVEEPKSFEVGSISIYGNNISRHNRYINNAVFDLTFSSTIEDSINEINTLLKQVKIDDGRGNIFKNFLFGIDESEKNYVDCELLESIDTKVRNQIIVLNEELKQYFLIQQYIEQCVIKNVELLNYLNKFDVQFVIEDSNYYIEICQNMKRDLIKYMISSKIDSIKKTLDGLVQQYIIVTNGIRDHSNTILSLELSSSAIIPLISTGSLIAKGIKSERTAIELNANLVDLLKNVINNNNEEANINFERIKYLSNTSDDVDSKIRDISNYLTLSNNEANDYDQDVDGIIKKLKKN